MMVKTTDNVLTLVPSFYLFIQAPFFFLTALPKTTPVVFPVATLNCCWSKLCAEQSMEAGALDQAQWLQRMGWLAPTTAFVYSMDQYNHVCLIVSLFLCLSFCTLFICL